MNNQDRIWLLISRKLTNEASEKDLQELNEFISQNPGIQPFMELATAMWKPGAKNDMSAAEQAFSKHMKRMQDMAQQKAVGAKTHLAG